MLRDYFTFSRTERLALILLIPAVVLLAVLIVRQREERQETALAESIATSSHKKPRDMAALSSDSALFSFDPNIADSATLRALGLSERVTSNIVKYRRTGARFHEPHDLARIYSMDSASFAALLPYICIPAQPQKSPRQHLRTARSVADSTAYPAVQVADTFPIQSPKQENPYREYMANKLHAGEFLDINRADTADLMRIPGVGRYYASAIVKYRQRLGGYTSLAQLQELGKDYDVDNLPANIGDWLTIDENVACRQINVNTATLKELKAHPYIGYYRARAICDLREAEGRIVGLRQLSFLDTFSAEDIARLAPYLSF